jgi:glycine/D-amino acid oxidase-like deaminating enzyme
MPGRPALSEIRSTSEQRSRAPIFDSGDVDVLVVGAGVVGLASAYHIKRQDSSAKVLVVEKALAAGQGDTAKSPGGVRNVFSSRMSRILADTSVNFYREQEKNGADLKLRFVTYLWLMSKKQFQTFESVKEGLNRDGVEVRVWSVEELKEKLPGFRFVLNRDDHET